MPILNSVCGLSLFRFFCIPVWCESSRDEWRNVLGSQCTYMKPSVTTFQAIDLIIIYVQAHLLSFIYSNVYLSIYIHCSSKVFDRTDWLGCSWISFQSNPTLHDFCPSLLVPFCFPSLWAVMHIVILLWPVLPYLTCCMLIKCAGLEKGKSSAS